MRNTHTNLIGCTVAVLLLAASAVHAQTFENTGSISIPGSGGQGPASPYPSSIVVSGLGEPIESLTVSLFGLSHTFSLDIDILLVGPGGETVVLMSDAGSEADISNVDLTFMDGEPLLPQNGQIVSGTYSPTNYGTGDTFDPPAPAGPFGSALSAFAGTSGNGTWSLFVFDDAAADSGSMAGGWSMTVTQQPPPPPITYQGRLSDAGIPLNDTADFEFSLQDASSGGTEIAFATADAVQVIDGLFTVELQFGGGAFGGEDRWVEILVRSPAGAGGFTTLSPLQRITPAPEAIHARAATTAAIAQAAFALDAPDGDPIEAVFVDNAGNVGIGTTSPQFPLHVRDNPAIVQIDSALANGTAWTYYAQQNTLRAAVGYRDANAGLTFFVNGSDRMVIEDSGQVGIGTVTPSAGLEIDMGAANDTALQLTSSGAGWGSGLQFENTSGTMYGIYSGADNNWHFANVDTGADIMTLNSANNVGIGTTNPTRGKVDIEGSQSFTIASYGFLNSSGSTGTAGGTQGYSLYASERIAASEFNAHSDARIKKVLGRSDSAADLNTLTEIEITDYTLIDTVAKGKERHKKVIGQQVNEVFPQAVSITTDVVPDIYELADVESGWIILETDLAVGDRVRLITEGKAAVYEVLEVRADSFRVDLPPAEKVFVFGREVDDFHNVDYEAIAMLNVSATQELHEQMRLKDTEIAALTERIERLESLIKAQSSK